MQLSRGPYKTNGHKKISFLIIAKIFFEIFGKFSRKYFVHFIYNIALQTFIETKKNLTDAFLWANLESNNMCHRESLIVLWNIAAKYYWMFIQNYHRKQIVTSDCCVVLLILMLNTFDHNKAAYGSGIHFNVWK